MNRFKKSGGEKKYSFKCNKYRKFKNPKISYIFDKILLSFIICNKRSSNDEKIFKEDIEILKFLGLINNMKR